MWKIPQKKCGKNIKNVVKNVENVVKSENTT